MQNSFFLTRCLCSGYCFRFQFSFFFLFSSCVASAQDTSGVQGWNVHSKKIGDGKYELIFSLPSTNGWQLYAPNQVLFETPTTVLQLADSSIKQDSGFLLPSPPSKISSGLLLIVISVGIAMASSGWFCENRCQPLWMLAVICNSYVLSSIFFVENVQVTGFCACAPIAAMSTIASI